MTIDTPATGAPTTTFVRASRRRLRFFFLVSLPLYFAVAVRTIDEGAHDRVPVTIALLLTFLLLFLTEHRLSDRYDAYGAVYIAAQIAVVTGLMIEHPELDFFPVLLIPVCAQVSLMPNALVRRWGFIAVIVTMSAGLLWFQDFPRSVALSLLFGAGYLLIASYASVTEQAERAGAQSQALVEELQDANRQLTANAATIEHLAIVEERNRLARELHDSVSQSLYGLVLSSEAARRNLASGNPDGIAAELDAMSEAARTALAEMRLLIYELRPPEIEEHGLQWALESRLATVERRAGLETTLDYDVTDDLPLRTEIELERIATEALTNAVRHSGATHAGVTVRQEGDRLMLEVWDDGAGFDPGTTPGGFGLRGMRERAERLGGSIELDARPNEGTRVRVETPL
jgi:signal transduction histidine kinase